MTHRPGSVYKINDDELSMYEQHDRFLYAVFAVDGERLHCAISLRDGKPWNPPDSDIEEALSGLIKVNDSFDLKYDDSVYPSIIPA